MLSIIYPYELNCQFLKQLDHVINSFPIITPSLDAYLPYFKTPIVSNFLK